MRGSCYHPAGWSDQRYRCCPYTTSDGCHTQNDFIFQSQVHNETSILMIDRVIVIYIGRMFSRSILPSSVTEERYATTGTTFPWYTMKYQATFSSMNFTPLMGNGPPL